MAETDLQLLERYASHKAEEAFAELVRRHLDLVHSAALRQVRSQELAEEVTQSVFMDLARQARKIEPGTTLTAWLYKVTRRTAIDVVRREASRRLREQVASEMNAMNAPNEWAQIEPLLDEAMEFLDEADRTALLLRYFENKSLRDVGNALGVSDDAAQKRVSRTVERLREFLAKRGVSAGASGLVLALSANAVQAAPGGMAIAVLAHAACVGTAFTTTAVTTATKGVIMTGLQKSCVLATFTAVIGLGVHEAKQVSTLRNQAEILQQELAKERTTAPVQEFARADEPRKDNTELLRLRNEVAQLRRQLEDLKAEQLQAATLEQEVESPAPSDEEMRQLGLAASKGDMDALGKLKELDRRAAQASGQANKSLNRAVRLAFDVLGEEAGSGSTMALEVLWKACRMDLDGRAIVALGQAAALGNEQALDLLLDPKTNLRTSLTPSWALAEAAKNGKVKAIDYLVALAGDPTRQTEWEAAALGLRNSAGAGNPAAIEALTSIGEAGSEKDRLIALRALENAAFTNHQARAIEALRSLGYK